MASEQPPIEQRVIVCAAIRNTRNEIICGVRHYDALMHAQIRRRGIWGPPHPVDQGFVDNKGIYMNRHEAWDVAMKAGQIKPGSLVRTHSLPWSLFSEDVW